MKIRQFQKLFVYLANEPSVAFLNAFNMCIPNSLGTYQSTNVIDMMLFSLCFFFLAFYREQDANTSKGGAWTGTNQTGLASKSRVVILASLALLCALMYTYQFSLL